MLYFKKQTYEEVLQKVTMLKFKITQFFKKALPVKMWCWEEKLSWVVIMLDS